MTTVPVALPAPSKKRRKKVTRKTFALLAILLISSLVAAFAAYAYFAASGSGSSTLTTGAGGAAVSIENGTSGTNCTYGGTAPYVFCIAPIPSGISPGGVVAVPVNTFVTGGTAGSDVPGYALGNLSATFSVPAGCTASWFHVNSSSAPANTSTSAPINVWTPAGGQVKYQTNKGATAYIHLDDTGVDQSTCTSKAVTVNWTLG